MKNGESRDNNGILSDHWQKTDHCAQAGLELDGKWKINLEWPSKSKVIHFNCNLWPCMVIFNVQEGDSYIPINSV